MCIKTLRNFKNIPKGKRVIYYFHHLLKKDCYTGCLIERIPRECLALVKSTEKNKIKQLHSIITNNYKMDIPY